MIWRALRAIEHLLTGALISLVVAGLRLLGRPPAWHLEVVRWWHARLCRILALELSVSGQLREGALLVANHISWLDIPVLGAQGSVGFLSKAEVRRWPVVGWMAAVAGTLFIERGANRFAEAIAAVRERISAGFAVVVFAEGTTSDGSGVRRFLPRLFAVVQPASELGSSLAGPIQLQPVALRYGQGPRPDAVAPFIDDDTLVRHLWRVLQHPGIRVHVSFLPQIDGRGQDRRHLADQARAAILDALRLHALTPEMGSKTDQAGLGAE
ncbi:2-acyl-glycerophospho-ethanolamine acyltransferase [Thiorhodovibrio winogradskyi]|uniref:2-acyl-glycerophospho-ethanolamine acyltransferase n=1 Tax=Thiorhodovibrio winogradskyi TaxID=77007 RepID=A0ABZ0S309_9GAMM|nr:lysophospholipid acyltransferase family protein [Thiorhodovibrio winogradskyi]